MPIMEMTIIQENNVYKNMCDRKDTKVVKYDWDEQISVKYIPTGEIQQRKVSKISLFNDMVNYNNEWCRIIEALSR